MGLAKPKKNDKVNLILSPKIQAIKVARTFESKKLTPPYTNLDQQREGQNQITSQVEDLGSKLSHSTLKLNQGQIE